MASVAVIPELETELSQARDAAGALLAQFAAMIEAERFSIYSILPPDVLARAREISARFHVPLVRVLALARQSQMLGSTDVDAIRLAAKRIEAALRLREYEEWGPQILNDEDRVLGVRPAGFSEDRWLPPDRALMEIDDALDQVLRRLGVLSAETEVELASNASPARLIPAAQACPERQRLPFEWSKAQCRAGLFRSVDTPYRYLQSRPKGNSNTTSALAGCASVAAGSGQAPNAPYQQSDPRDTSGMH
jgi:hypothetical protein